MESLVHAANSHAAADGHSVGGGVDDDGREWGNVNHDGGVHIVERDAPAVTTVADKHAMIILFRV